MELLSGHKQAIKGNKTEQFSGKTVKKTKNRDRERRACVSLALRMYNRLTN